MAKKLKSNVSFAELNRKLASAVKNLPEVSNRFLDMEAEALVTRTKRLTPVRTGHLRGKWHRHKAKNAKATVYNNVEYAGHVEYGHRTRGGGLVSGRYMLHKAMGEMNDNFEEDAEALFEELLL